MYSYKGYSSAIWFEISSTAFSETNFPHTRPAPPFPERSRPDAGKPEELMLGDGRKSRCPLQCMHVLGPVIDDPIDSDPPLYLRAT